MALRLGDIAPDFEADTSAGRIRVSSRSGRWMKAAAYTKSGGSGQHAY